jgi:hypothetical protein
VTCCPEIPQPSKPSRALGLTETGTIDFTDDDDSINDRYCPNDPVTRAQMAAFALGAFG